MRFFKYLVFLSFLISTYSYAYEDKKYYLESYPTVLFDTPEQACRYKNEALTFLRATSSGSCYYNNKKPPTADVTNIGYYKTKTTTITCPSAQKVGLKVPLNAQKYQCVNQCQYAIVGCVDIPEERGQTCTAISTGIDCGGTPPTKPKDPADNTQTPDAPTDTPAAPGQNPSNTNTNSATTTGTSTSTSTSTTTNNTTTNTSTTNTTTTTNINTTTKIDLSSLESAIESIGKLLGGKLDAIKEALGGDKGSENGSPDGTDLTETNSKLDDIKKNGDKLNNWLQGKNEDGTGGVGDNPFGTDVTPERTLDAQSFKTNIFQSNAQCPADKTLSMTLFTGKTFTRTLSFSMWCDKLAIFGSLILIAAYLYGASIIVRNS